MTERKRGRPSPEQMAQIDEAILRAAVSNFGAYGYEAAQIAQIAAEAGVTKVTLYKRYDSKAQILAAALNAASEELMADLIRITQSGEPPMVTLRKLLSTMLERCLSANELMIQRLIFAHSSHSPAVSQCLQHWRRAFDQLVEAVVRSILAESRTQRLDDAAVIAETIVDIVTNGLLIRTLNLDGDEQTLTAAMMKAFDARWPIVEALASGEVMTAQDSAGARPPLH